MYGCVDVRVLVRMAFNKALINHSNMPYNNSWNALSDETINHKLLRPIKSILLNSYAARFFVCSALYWRVVFFFRILALYSLNRYEIYYGKDWLRFHMVNILYRSTIIHISFRFDGNRNHALNNNSINAGLCRMCLCEAWRCACMWVCVGLWLAAQT